MKKIYILLLAIVSCIVLYILEQVISVNYLFKTIAKIIVFVIIPIYYMKKMNSKNTKKLLNISNVKISELKIGFILGMFSFSIIMLAYLVLKEYIDFNIISNELQTKLMVTPKNFIIVGIYITFVNSFIEEFFFRNFIFLNLNSLGYRKLAYTFSSFLFGIYHIAIFKTWFSPFIMAIALFGLIGVGFIFNWLNIKSKNILNSWIVHILADSAIILIGMNMFDII